MSTKNDNSLIIDHFNEIEFLLNDLWKNCLRLKGKITDLQDSIISDMDSHTVHDKVTHDIEEEHIHHLEEIRPYE